MVGALMKTEEAADYVRSLDAAWTYLQSTSDGRRRLLDDLPAPERRLLEKAPGHWLDVEMPRRRKTVSRVLLSSFPVTYFAYVAVEGAEGVMRFLESRFWRSRQTQPGSAFPPAASTSLVFSQYLDDSRWIDRQQGWIKDAYSFEKAFLFGESSPSPREVEGRKFALAEAAWVAEAPYDVPACVEIIRERRREDPWHDALYFVKPEPMPFAMVSIPSAGSVRRIRLTGDSVKQLRWLWDLDEPVPSQVLASPVFGKAVEAAIVRSIE